jgi:hypothetical protein
MHTGYALVVISSRLTLALTAVAAGALLGPGDLLAQRALPYPWANLANSSAVWALAAFAIGAWTANRRERPGAWPAAAAVVLLLVAVETYYVAAVLFLDNSTSQLWAPTTLFWLGLAVVAGATFGTAGGWSREGVGLRRALGAALPTAVLLAEAGLLATRPDNGDAAYRTDNLQTAAIEAALAVLCLLVAARDTRQRVHALALSLPLAATALTAFRLAGFGQ